MNVIRQELTSRRSEIDEFLDVLGKFEDGTYLVSHQNNLLIYPLRARITQKSCAVLLLYNVVESIVTKVLIRIHEVVISENVGYFDLNPNIRDLTLVYFNSVMSKTNDFHEALPFVRGLIQMLTSNYHFHIPYKEMEKYYSLYSGNLDSKKIGDTLEKYGVDFRKPVRELQTVKNGRNKLAHGEVSFEEYGRDLSMQQINVLKVKIFEFLDEMISNVDNFILTKAYKSSMA